MVVELHTADGKIRKYETVYGIDACAGDTHYIEKYVSGCGLEWKNKPTQHEECDHLDCAIYLAKRKRKNGPKGFALFIAIAVGMIIYMGKDLGFALLFPGIIALLAFSSLFSGFSAGNQLNELSEYKNKGTIKDVKAFQIHR